MVDALASGAQETVSRSLPTSLGKTPIPCPVCASLALWASPPGATGLASFPDSKPLGYCPVLWEWCSQTVMSKEPS